MQLRHSWLHAILEVDEMVKGDMPSVTSGKAEKLEAVTNRRSLQETKSYIWHGLLNLFYSRLWFALVTNQHVDRKVSCAIPERIP